MIRQESTYYEDFTIKTFSEFTGGVLTRYIQYNKLGQETHQEVMDDVSGIVILSRISKYRGKKLISKHYSDGQWDKYSYSKTNNTYRLMVNRPAEKSIWIGIFNAETDVCIDSRLLDKKTKK
jgi:hypothetical protein